MSAELDAAFESLSNEVQRNKTVDGSAKALLTRLNAMLVTALAGDDAELRAKVTEITETLKSDNDKMVADVLANTPVDPITPPTPVPHPPPTARKPKT